MRTGSERSANRADASSLFERVICVIDGSREGIEAAWQAAVLAPREADLRLVTTLDGADEFRARQKLAEAQDAIAELHPATTHLRPGKPADALRSEVEREHATLLSSGMYPGSLVDGLASGDPATALLHRAPCSVLIARPPADPEQFPRLVIVGTDGSPRALAAIEAASELRTRLGCEIQAVVALGSGHPDLDTARDHAAGNDIPLATDRRDAIEALSNSDADLIVVGSRARRGLHALASFSERVAHHATSSVLVVRDRPEH